MKKLFIFGLILIMAYVSLASCKKKEEQPVPKAPQTAPGIRMVPDAQMSPGAQMPSAQGQIPAGHGVDEGTAKRESKVVVPDIVKGKWVAVKLNVEDKSAQKALEYTVNLNSELKIPGSGLKVSVGEFLPDFRMDESIRTSVSNEPNNPAVMVVVYEDGKEIFKGWLYSKFPMIHPFEHPRYNITLKEGVKKG